RSRRLNQSIRFSHRLSRGRCSRGRRNAHADGCYKTQPRMAELLGTTGNKAIALLLPEYGCVKAAWRLSGKRRLLPGPPELAAAVRWIESSWNRRWDAKSLV